MEKILFYDTETSGLPNWKVPSEDPSQPHLVQLAAVLCNADTEEIIQSIDLIIRPDGWTIPEEVTEVHGITTEMAMELGVPERTAFCLFIDLWKGCNRAAHNRTFDQRILRIAAKRYSSEAIIDAWADKETHECTMLLAKPIMKLEPKGRYGFKSPKLSEAYEYFTGKPLENAHTAMADTLACKEIYFAMKRGMVEQAQTA